MSSTLDQFREGLRALLVRIIPGSDRVEDLRRLSAGATLETWSFDAVGASARHPLILRRSPGGLRSTESLSLEVEADLIRALAGTGVPVPTVVHTLLPAEELGDGFLMTRIEGETIPRKILRDQEFAGIRPQLVPQFGRILAALHAVDTSRLPALPVRPTGTTLERLQKRYEAMGRPSAVFDVAFRWLRDNAPSEISPPRLVHGDFRNGNLMFGSDGVRAVLDWEIAHLGDPAEDLAWVCLPPWRFGELDRPVGGLGPREEMYRAYETASGTTVDRDRVRYWEMLGSLRWGVGCAGMFEWFGSGRDPSVERAMIARRVSENEMDLMRILAGKG